MALNSDPAPVGSSQSTNRENTQKTISRLDEDLSTLGQISKLSETLSFPHQVTHAHIYVTLGSYFKAVPMCMVTRRVDLRSRPQSLDDVIKDLMASVHRELAEKQSLAFSSTFLPTKLELTTVSAESTFIFEFTSPDARSGFEQTLEDAKKKLGETHLDRLWSLCKLIYRHTETQVNIVGNYPSSNEQGPLGPRVPQGYPHHED